MLDCIAASHKKYGSRQGLEAAKARARATADKAKATLQGGAERRRWVEPVAAVVGGGLAACGRKPPHAHTCTRRLRLHGWAWLPIPCLPATRCPGCGREEIEGALEEAGLEVCRFQRKKQVKAFIKVGLGSWCLVEL